MQVKCTKCYRLISFDDAGIKSASVDIFCPFCNNRIRISLARNDEPALPAERDEEQSEKIRKYIDKIEDLPTLPIVIQRILTLVNDPRSTVRQIGGIINSDQSLTAKTLKLVNSAFYGFEKKISTVDQAIVIIGFDAVKNLAISASVFDIFKGIKQKSSFHRHGFWTHSIATAFISKEICEDINLGNTGEVFVAGLLHDIGKLMLDIYFPEEMNKILYQAANMNLSFLQSEESLLSINHSLIGYYLAKRWNLPEVLTWPIRFHHHPQKGERFAETVSIVHIANIIAKAGKIGYDGDNSMPKISVYAWNTIKKRKPDLSLESIKYYIDIANQKLEQSNFVALATVSEE